MPSFRDALVTGCYQDCTDQPIYCLRFGADLEALYIPRSLDEAAALKTALDKLSSVRVLFDGHRIVTIADPSFLPRLWRFGPLRRPARATH